MNPPYYRTCHLLLLLTQLLFLPPVHKKLQTLHLVLPKFPTSYLTLNLQLHGKPNPPYPQFLRLTLSPYLSNLNLRPINNQIKAKDSHGHSNWLPRNDQLSIRTPLMINRHLSTTLNISQTPCLILSISIMQYLDWIRITPLTITCSQAARRLKRKRSSWD